MTSDSEISKTVFHKLALLFFNEAKEERQDIIQRYLLNISFYYSIKYQKIQEHESYNKN